ncbi:MAG: hemerythrin domain-containing protein [Acidimicrobiales bacterium]
MGPTAELTAEHDEILGLAWEVAEAQRGVQVVADEVLARLLDLRARHSAKEERGLFPLVLEAGDCTPEQIATLEQEHRDQRAILEAGTFSRDDYYALAAHVEEEEFELFPMAMFGFDDVMWDEMDAVHRSVEEER